MRRLKADFHSHAAGDPRDHLLYSPEMLIQSAADEGIEVLALTCHEGVIFSDRLAQFADRKGVLLIPGIEQLVEGYHVLILNPDPEQARARTFAELRTLGRRDAATAIADRVLELAGWNASAGRCETVEGVSERTR